MSNALIAVSYTHLMPSKENSVFYLEYTITDAVVLHDAVAELFWNVLGDGYTAVSYTHLDVYKRQVVRKDAE